MKKETWDLDKFKDFIEEAGYEIWQGIGVLQAMWLYTARETPLGDIGSRTDHQIARGLGFKGDFQALLALLKKYRWVDEHPQYRLVVHDWHDHVEDYIKKRVTRAGEQFRSSNITKLDRQMQISETKPEELREAINSTYQYPAQPAADNGGQRQTTADNGGQCLPTYPIHNLNHNHADPIDARARTPEASTQAPSTQSRSGSVGSIGELIQNGVGNIHKFHAGRSPDAPDSTNAPPAAPQQAPPPEKMLTGQLGAVSAERAPPREPKSKFVNRVMHVTQDPETFRQWWISVLKLMNLHDGVPLFLEAMDYMQKARDPKQRDLKAIGELQPNGKYLAAVCRDYLLKKGIRLPPPPAAEGKQS